MNSRTRAAISTLAVAFSPFLAGPGRAVTLHAAPAQSPARPSGALDRDDVAFDRPASFPAGVVIERDVPYGRDERQRFDVYHTAQASRTPVVFMVHGGAWHLGDKAMQRVVEGKVARWVPRGLGLISVNYRMLPAADPIEQARDVARALAVAQQRATEWGFDRSRFVLMGHSAGAHLVALIATSPSLATGAGTTAWLGTVSLDSGAMDVVEIMERPHFRFYDSAFGRDPAFWRSASPYHALTAATRPILEVCSTRRADSCAQAHRFAVRAQALGVMVSVLEKDFSHAEINARLGEEPVYTAEVERFLAGLDTTLAGLLK